MGDGKQESQRDRTRISYTSDVEAGASSNCGHTSICHRSRSSSMATCTTSRNRSVDPGLVLPAYYRTLSMRIEEGKHKAKEEDETTKKSDIDFGDITWHKLSIHDVLLQFSSSLSQGLSSEQVAKNIKQYGPNQTSPPPSRWFRKTMKCFFGGFGLILFFDAILAYIAWKPLGQRPQQSTLALAIVLTFVFFTQAAFAFYQGILDPPIWTLAKMVIHQLNLSDFSSSRIMASIKTMLPEHCVVIRNAVQQNISGAEVLPGDLLCIKTGDRLPADVRFLEVSTNVRFDRSVLTGETVPMYGSVHSTDDNYLETTCVGMAGTHCIAGSSVGLVVATGDRTVIGRIAKFTATPKEGSTPLQREISYFITIVVGLMLIVIALVIVVWAAWLRKHHPLWIPVPQLIVACVTVAVAFVPEGLPIAVTSSLIITASIMKKNKIFCKSLETVEKLGSVSIICSDKTSTLTKNQMTVTECMVGCLVMTAAEAAEIGNVSSDGPEELAIMGGICNAGGFDAATTSMSLVERKMYGDATDQAILRFAESIVPVAEARKQFKTIFKVAFNSKDKFMIQTVQPTGPENLETSSSISEPDAPLVLMIKGAPDVLVTRCDAIMTDDGKATRAITVEDFQLIERVKNQWSSSGRRVILLARKKLPIYMHSLSTTSREYEERTMEEATKGLELVGLVAMVDPPQDEVPDAVRTLRGAGIRVAMITGDDKLTAEAIAAQCGIITRPDTVDGIAALSDDDKLLEAQSLAGDKAAENVPTHAIAISGAELNQLGDNEWDKLCKYQEIIFARTSPEQKLRIVNEFQSRDEVVGMTGDGVNDAPSLKASDIGIAMGTGSEVAMEAADVVLLDSFAAIVEAVKHGRVMFDNLKKTICYLMPAGIFSELWPIITSIFLGMPQILSSFLMNIICYFTDCAAATAIAYEKPEGDVLIRQPRNLKKDRLVNWKLLFHAHAFLGVIMALCSFSMSYWYVERKGIPFRMLALGFGKVPDGMSQEYFGQVLNEASSIYFINLVIMQLFNLFAIRTRRLSILQHPPIFRRQTRNYKLFLTILFALAVALITLYIPKLQTVLGTSGIPVENFFFPMAFGMALLLLDEARKLMVRKWPNGFLAKIAW